MSSIQDDIEMLCKLVWRRQGEEVVRWLRASGEQHRISVINGRDRRGNSPLHVAVHFGFGELVYLLRKYGGDVLQKNGGGYTLLQEAVASGASDVLLQLYFAQQKRFADELEIRMQRVRRCLNALPDFDVDIQWLFKSWVPLVSRWCPGDTMRIVKRGTSLRCGYTLVGFDGRRAVRGNQSVVIRDGDMVTVDYDKRTVSWLRTALRYYDQQKLRAAMMRMLASKVTRTNARLHDVSFARAKTWLGHDRFDHLHRQWHAAVYSIHSFRFETTRRSDPSVKRHAGKKKSSSSGAASSSSSSSSSSSPSSSPSGATSPKLRYPRQPKEQSEYVTFDEYFNTEPPANQGKGTGMIWPCEEVVTHAKDYQGKLWMAKDFPFELEQLMPIFEALAPSSKHFTRFYEFLTSRLPVDAGFPVQFQIPVYPTITCQAGFLNLSVKDDDDNDDDLFTVPDDFTVAQEPIENPEFIAHRFADVAIDQSASSSSS
jgi:ankyrin repeat domain-containing protein 13